MRRLIELRVFPNTWVLTPSFEERIVRLSYQFNEGCHGVLVAQSASFYPVQLSNVRSFTLKPEQDVFQLAVNLFPDQALAFKAIPIDFRSNEAYCRVLIEVDFPSPPPGGGGNYDEAIEAINDQLQTLQAQTSLITAQGEAITAVNQSVVNLQSSVAQIQGNLNGFKRIHYDQTARPTTPQNGEYWLERTASGNPLELWYWNDSHSKWLSEQTYYTQTWMQGLTFEFVGNNWNGGLQNYGFTSHGVAQSAYGGDGLYFFRSGIHATLSAAFSASTYPILGFMPGGFGSRNDTTITTMGDLSTYTSTASPLIRTFDHSAFYSWSFFNSQANQSTRIPTIEPYYKTVGWLNSTSITGLLYWNFKLYRD